MRKPKLFNFKSFLICFLFFCVLSIPVAAYDIAEPIGLNNSKINLTHYENGTIADDNNTPASVQYETGNTISEQKSKDYSQQDLGAGMIQKGIDLVVYSAADAIGSIWKNNTVTEALNENQNVTDEYGATRGTIFTFITKNPKPDKIEAIQKFESNTKATWAFLVGVFILGFVTVSNIYRSNRTAFSNAFGGRDMSDSRFVGGTILCVAAYAAPKAILISIYVCDGLSKFAMLNVLDYIAPSADNAFMYLFMAIGEAIVSIFFIIRPWAIDIVYAASRLLAILFFMGIFRDEIEWVFRKYVKVLLLQPVCIFVSCICLIALKTTGMQSMAGAYLMMFIFIAYINYKWMFGNFGLSTIKRVAKVAVYKR